MYQDSNNMPSFNAADLFKQWLDVYREGDSISFGCPKDFMGDVAISEASRFEGAKVICHISDYDCFLVWWSDAYYLVCDDAGYEWVACQVYL